MSVRRSMDAAACLTTEAELLFLIEELRRRERPHHAHRTQRRHRQRAGLHGCGRLGGIRAADPRTSGVSPRSTGSCWTFIRATIFAPPPGRRLAGPRSGRNHFKVSPSLQVIFGEVLHEVSPERFQFWWDDTLAYARREAAAGSDFAAQCLREYESSEDPAPSPHHARVSPLQFRVRRPAR